MIVELVVENLAIIERAHVSFSRGFSSLTGETGAGKSLLIDALELALGERADSDLVRTGCPRAQVQVVFDLASRPDLKEALLEFGVHLPDDDPRLYVQRDVTQEGRSTCRLNGAQCPVSTLKRVGILLVDLHGQHKHQSLMDPEQHVGYLDGWIGSEAQELLEQIRNQFEAYAQIESQLRQLKVAARDREQRLDLLRFQVNEIQSADIQAGEFAEIQNQIQRLQNVSKLQQIIAEARLALEGDDERQGAASAAQLAAKALHDACRVDSTLSNSFDQLQELLPALQQIAIDVSRYADELEADPLLLDELVRRQDLLRRLQRKYGETEDEILAFLSESERQLDLLADSETSLVKLEGDRAKALKNLENECSRLTQLRKERAFEFVASVMAHLRELSFGSARLDVSIQPKSPGSDGADLVEFLFSANVGEDLKPLAKIGSGGEISRVMLAMKSALAGKIGVPTLIFDEVDSGLGGKAAATMGKKLAELGQHYQVLVISHLPQVAAQARHQFSIEKVTTGDRVATRITPLDQEDRVTEIARMLAGDDVSESARANARELLGYVS